LNESTLNPLRLSTLQFVRFLPALTLTFQADEWEQALPLKTLSPTLGCGTSSSLSGRRTEGRGWVKRCIIYRNLATS